MKERLVKSFLNLFKDDVIVSVVTEKYGDTIYHGTVASVPKNIGYRQMLTNAFLSDGDAFMIAILVEK